MKRTNTVLAQQHTRLAILGAGLTGLSAALESQTRGVQYRLFEREQWTGGLARTTLDSGYRFDRTGHLLHVKDQALKTEVLDWLGPSYHVIQRESRVWSHGVYTPYPFQANTHGLPPTVIYECVLGFIRAQQKRDNSATTPPTAKNFEEYCRLHFGDGISEHFMLPYNGRLWGVAPNEITTEWCERFVPLPMLEDVIGGAVGLAPRQLGYNAEFIYPNGGIGALAQAIERQLSCVALGKELVLIDYEQKQLFFRDETVSYDHLVSSIPLVTLLKLCKHLPEEIACLTRQLRCTHLYYLDIALRVPCTVPWHWVYVPETKYPFYRVGCYSNFSPDMAPAGSASLYAELVDRTPSSIEQLLPPVIEGLLEMQIINSASDIRFARLRRIDHAYVIFDHNYGSVTAKAHAFLREHGIVSTGRYGQWTYSSMEDALLNGRQALTDLGI